MGNPFLASLLFIAMTTAVTTTSSFPFDQTPYANPQRLVDVGHGRRMNLYCIGSGSPTIVLENGFGSPMWTWGYVQPALAKLSRTCAYDRAAYGFSDPAPVPRTAAVIAADLHALLGRANIQPPYVLVGHSLGGYHVRLFADMYPNTVAGLVLIDPATMAIYPILDSIRSIEAADMADDKRRHTCLVLSEERRFDVPSWKPCVETDPRYSPEMIAGRQWTKRRPGYWKDVDSEIVSGPTDERELRAARVGYAHKALVVLTAKGTWSASDLGTSPQKIRALHEALIRAHDEMAAESSLGVNRKVPQTSHFIQIDRPAVVIAAVRAALDDSDGATPSCAKIVSASPGV